MSMNTSTPDDSLAVVHSRRYLGLLVFAAFLGVPTEVDATARAVDSLAS